MKTQAEIITDLIIRLLKDFNERRGGNFKIDRTGILETTLKLIDRETFGCYVAFAKDERIGIIKFIFLQLKPKTN
jgi:hypothetical protein